METPARNNETDFIKDSCQAIGRELAKVVVGQEDLIKNILICLLCGGHAMIEGVPGLGKTLVVNSLSRILGLKYSRIQFTPDLMPADILGTNMVMQDDAGRRYFEFYKGPIFGQIVLADEINRATPKTQSALLEAMQEEAVTIFGTRHRLDPPFIVLATQNPIEMEGTYPLPEAQIDRFFFKLNVQYPNHEQLIGIVDQTTEAWEPTLNEVTNVETILEMRKMVRQVPIASHVKDYAVRIVLATHPESEYAPGQTADYVRYGASPRGAQALVLASKVRALLEGRFNVALEDVRVVAKPALRHRIILNLKGEAEGIDTGAIVDGILDSVPDKTR